MTPLWLLNWWNLIFVVPFGLALLYLGLYTVSGITFGDADADHDFDVDHDVDVDHDAELSGDVDHDADVDQDADADGDGDADQDADGDHDAESDSESGGTSPALAALQWLGVGRVPLSILLMVLLMAWGWTGVIVNVLMERRVAEPWRAVIFSVPLAMLISVMLTRAISSGIARWMPLCATSARRRHELLGSVGEAVYAINERFGMACVRDDGGDLHQIPCRVGAGQTTIVKGKKVKLVAYNAKQGIFTVVPWQEASQPQVSSN